MFLDVTTPKTEATGISGEAPPGTKYAYIPLERSQVLMSFGLTDRDLEFMGPEQRAMVDDVINRVMCTHAAS